MTLAGNEGTQPTEFEIPRPFEIAAVQDPFPASDNFDRPSFTTILGDDWREVTGNLSISATFGGYLQAATGADIALYNSVPVSNVRLRADIGVNSLPPFAGLISRYQLATGDRYIGLVVSRSGQKFLEIQKVVGGLTTVLASVATSASSGNLDFETTGSLLKLRYAGLTLTATDTSLSQPGLFGVFVGANSVLDDFFAGPTSP
jgi:hypothetical protein